MTSADNESLLPDGWVRSRLKNSVASTQNGIWGADPNGVDDIRCVRVADFDRASQTIHDNDVTFRAVTASERANRLVKSGDLLLEKSGGGEKSPVGFVVLYDRDEPAICSNFVARVVIADGMDPRFWMYVHGSNYSRRLTSRSIKQSTGIQNLDETSYLNEIVTFPPAEVQRDISKFLDRETAEIDAFIADQEELIGLLAERRDGAWQEAVDSLNAPEVRLRRVIENIADGPFGSSLTSSHYADSGARVVRLGNIGINVFKDDDRVFISMEYFEDLKAHEIRAGEVVVAGLGDEKMPLGRAAVVPSIGRAIVKADCYRVRPGPLVTSEYLAWVLSAPQTRARLRLLARGSTRQRLNTAVVRDVEIPLPTLAAQGSILEISKTAVETMDLAIADAKEAIALSRERRAALISAAVTGKIDVREHGAVA